MEKATIAIGLIIDMLACHYSGITELDITESKKLREIFLSHQEKLNALHVKDAKELVTWGQHENIVRAYAEARKDRNKKVLNRLEKIIAKMAKEERDKLISRLGSFSFSSNNEQCLLLSDKTKKRNKAIVEDLEGSFGESRYQFKTATGVFPIRARLGNRIHNSFLLVINELSSGIKIKHEQIQNKLNDMHIVVLQTKDRDESVCYSYKENALIVNPSALYLNKAELRYYLVKTAICFFQYTYLSSQDICLLHKLSVFARRAKVIPPVTAIEVLNREVVAEVIALGFIPKEKWNGKLYRSRNFILLCAVVRYLQEKKKMSAKGATKLCLNVGSVWAGNQPVVKKFVRCFSEFSKLRMSELELALTDYNADTALDRDTAEIVVNSINAAMLSSVIDANPFIRSPRNLHEHMDKHVARECRQDIANFVVSYKQREASGVNLEKVVSYMFVGLKELGFCCEEKCLDWANFRLSDKVILPSRKLTLDALPGAQESELYFYIQFDMQKEFEQCRDKINVFKRTFVGSGMKKEKERIQSEMIAQGNDPCAVRWNVLIKNFLGSREKDSKGLPRISTLIERIRRDNVCGFLADESVGCDMLLQAGSFSARAALCTMLKNGGRRVLTMEERKNFLATGILGVMYSTPIIMKKSPEEKLGIFIESYFLAEEGIENEKLFTSTKNIKK